MKNSLKKAFTLIELLVVISIIALLLSILMPSLGKVKKHAKRVVCATNFRQVGIVNYLYVNDYNQYIPRFLRNSSNEFFTVAMGQPVTAIIPYFLDEDIYQDLKNGYNLESKFWVCSSLLPKNAKRGILRDVDFDQDDLPSHGAAPYPRIMGIAHLVGLINMTAGKDSGQSLPNPTTVKKTATKPTKDRADCVLAADLNIRWENDWNHEMSVVSHVGVSKDGKQMPAGGNRLYVDGSAEWIKPTEMARDNGSILADGIVEGKYDHWPAGGGRDYFW